MTEDHKQVPDEEIHIDEVDARGANTSGTVRYVLGISLLLAIIAMSAFWIVPALSS